MNKLFATNIPRRRSKLVWVPDGGEIEDGWEAKALLAIEERPVGAGTNARRWHLLVLSATERAEASGS